MAKVLAGTVILATVAKIHVAKIFWPRKQNSWPTYFGRGPTGLQPQACVAKIDFGRPVAPPSKTADFGPPPILATVAKTHTRGYVFSAILAGRRILATYSRVVGLARFTVGVLVSARNVTLRI